jgi:hypothetical protein
MSSAPANKVNSQKGSSRDDGDLPFVEADPLDGENFLDPEDMRKSEVY